MNEMVERVARALARADGLDQDKVRFPDPNQKLGGVWGDQTAAQIFPNDIGRPIWHSYVKAARSAIEALCEPTQAMIDACPPPRELPSSEEVWRAMIDAAPNETKDQS